MLLPVIPVVSAVRKNLVLTDEIVCRPRDAPSVKKHRV